MFKFELGQEVSVFKSGEQGEIIGRAEFKSSKPTYNVRYVAADGRAVESWWAEDALTAI